MTSYPGVEQADLREASNDTGEFIDPKALKLYGPTAAKQPLALKIGSSWRFSCRDMDTWIQRQMAETLDGKPRT